MVATRFFSLLVGFMLTLVVTQTTVQASIEITPAVLISQYWTDNRSLAADDQREAETITEIQPELTLQLDSRRHQAMLNARYQYLAYRRADETREFQQYSAASSSILAPDLLFIDLAASKFQSAVSQQDVVAANNLSLISNRTDVSSYNIHPYLSKQWSPRWRSRIDYNYNDIRYETAQFNDRQTQELKGQVGYGQSGGKIQVDLSYKTLKSENDLLVNANKFDEIRLDTRYQVNNSWALLFNAGYEDNQYESASAVKTEGGFGEVGVEVNPTRKIVFRGVVGDRYYGNSSMLSLQYNYSNQAGLEIGYRKELTLRAASLLQSGVQPGVDNQINALSDTFLSSEVYRSERSDVRLYYQWTKSRGEILAYRQKRGFQLSLGKEVVDYVGVSWDRDIMTKSMMEIDLVMRDRAFDSQPGDDRLLSAQMRLLTNPTKNVSLGGAYGMTSRSGGAFQSYKQQQFSLFARVAF